MKTKHTPGPWKAYNQIGSRILQSWYVGSDTAAVCRVGDGALSPEETVANARLIAAAPELLAALNLIIAAYGNLQSGAIDLARSAIAKAEGRE
jgi:hypothetical protein